MIGYPWLRGAAPCLVGVPDRDELIEEQGYLDKGTLKPKTAPSGEFGSFHMRPP